MMQQRRLLVAAALVAAMIVLVVLFGHQQRPHATLPGTEGRWLPGLEQQLAEVQRVRLQSGPTVATLVRVDGRWGVEERAGYAVDMSRLVTLLRDLAQARRLEQKTSRPEYFDRLGLADVEKPDSKAVLLELWTTGDAPLHRLLIGNAAEGRDGRYVRGADVNETWLVDRSLQAFADPADWLDRSLLDLDFADVAAVGRSVPGKSGFRAARAARGQPSLVAENIPSGHKPRYDSVFDSAARSILGAEAEDVKRPAEGEFAEGKVARTDIVFYDGLQLQVEALKGEEGNWVMIRALAGTPYADAAPEAEAPAMVAAGEAATAESGDQQKPAEEAGAAGGQEELVPAGAKPLEERVAEINQRLGGWAYKVSDYLYGELSKPLEDYLDEEKPVEPAKDADAG